MKIVSDPLHVSLFSTGWWKTKGYFYDETGEPSSAEGKTQVLYRAKHWLARNTLYLSKNRMIESHYMVKAIGTETASWTSRNSLLKDCRGTFQVKGDLILSTFASDDDLFTGYEILRKIADTHYTNFGELYFRKQRHSSWHLELHKRKPVEGRKPMDESEQSSCKTE